MAFSLGYTSTTLLISLTLILTTLPNPTHAKDNTNVTTLALDTICQTTLDSAFCQHTLKPFQNQSTTLRRIAKSTIDSANSHAMATEKKIKGLIATTVDAKKKEGYVSCVKDYADAITALRDASRDIVKGHYGDVKNNAQNAMEEARSCEGLKPAGDDSLWLHERNDSLEKHGSVIVAIANQLQKEG